MTRVTGLDHVNIRTMDLAASISFYEQVLGLTATPPDGLIPPTGANWLFDANGQPILHLRLLEPDGPTTGPFDHVALRCDDLAGTIARLDAAGIRHDSFDNAAMGTTLLFIVDPHGVRLELAFAKD